MPFDDLDLEFEDEDEKKKSNDVSSDSNLDLDFQKPDNVVTPIGEARKNLPQANKVVGNLAVKAQPQVQVPNAEINHLRQELKDANQKLTVSEVKLQILSELNGDIKLLDYQINQYLIKIAKNHPDSKNDLLMIKKLLSEFAQKKRN